MRYIIIALMVSVLSTTAFAQKDEAGVEATVLSSQQLESKKWYYSLDEAMRAPADEVYKLSLEKKRLKKLPAEVYRFKNLHVLNLNRNKLKTLPSDISRLTQLQYLSLYKNKVRFLPEEIKDLAELRTLYLGRNKLTEVPAWVGGLGKLRTLDLSRNYLTPYEIDKVRKALPRCKISR